MKMIHMEPNKEYPYSDTVHEVRFLYVPDTWVNIVNPATVMYEKQDGDGMLISDKKGNLHVIKPGWVYMVNVNRGPIP